MSDNILSASADFETELQKYTHERKPVSDRLYQFLHLLVLIMTACSVAFAATYAVQLGEGVWFRFVIAGAAVGIECALVFFAATMYPKPVLITASSIAGGGVVLISIFTAASFLLSQQFAADHKVAELEKDYVSHLQSNLESVNIESAKDRSTIAAVSDRIERSLDRLKGQKGSKATAIYHAIAHSLGYSVESVSLLIRLIWALVFVSTTIALASYLETIYSPGSLAKWARELNKRKSVLVGLQADYNSIPAYAGYRSSPVMHISEASESPLVDTNDRYRRTVGVGENISETAYQRIKKAVLDGTLKPKVASLKEAARGTERAYQAIDRMIHEGIILQKSNGRYALAS